MEQGEQLAAGQMDSWTHGHHSHTHFVMENREFCRTHEDFPTQDLPTAQPQRPTRPIPAGNSITHLPQGIKPCQGSRAAAGEGEGVASVDKEPFFSCRETFKMLCQHGRVVYVSPAGKVPIDSGLFPPPHRYFLPWEFFFFFSKWDFFFFFFTQRQQRRDGAAGIWGLDLLIWGVLEGFGHPVPTPSPLPVPINGKEQSKDLG